MSLQVLKLKSNIVNSPHARKDGFTLHGGHRTTSYIGKTMHNSPNGTRFKGIYPVNFSQTEGVISNSTSCHQIIELRGQSPAVQKSVGNTRSMIYSRNKWIKGGVYPNVWVQPTTAMTYDEYMKIVRFREECADTATPEPDADVVADEQSYNNTCQLAFPPSEVYAYHLPLDKLKRCNSGTVKRADPAIYSSSEHTKKLQFKCIQMVDPRKRDSPSAPFPYYTSNTSVLNTGLISCGAMV